VSDAMVVTEHIEELFASERAEDLMDTDPVVCRRSERILDATARMIECDVNDMPILDDRGRVIGNLDILQLLDLWLKEEKELC
jgi:predicted transcriptional regulator